MEYCDKGHQAPADWVIYTDNGPVYLCDAHAREHLAALAAKYPHAAIAMHPDMTALEHAIALTPETINA